MAIISSILLYVLWMLLPAVIAIGIFRLFPDTKVRASGPFQNLTINVTGAFGAFFITLLAGWFLIDRIDARIQQSLVSPTWEVMVKVSFLDNEGEEIRVDRALREDVKVFVEPPIAKTAELPYVYVRLPLVKPGEWPTLYFNVPGFISETLSPRRLIADGEAEVDSWRQRVDLGEMVLRQVPDIPSSARPRVEAYLAPAPGGPPMPAVPGEASTERERP